MKEQYDCQQVLNWALFSVPGCSVSTALSVLTHCMTSANLQLRFKANLFWCITGRCEGLRCRICSLWRGWLCVSCGFIWNVRKRASESRSLGLGWFGFFFCASARTEGERLDAVTLHVRFYLFKYPETWIHVHAVLVNCSVQTAVLAAVCCGTVFLAVKWLPPH